MRKPESVFNEADAGLQPNMFNSNEKEVRIIGKGQVRQLKLDDLMLLEQWKQNSKEAKE